MLLRLNRLHLDFALSGSKVSQKLFLSACGNVTLDKPPTAERVARQSRIFAGILANELSIATTMHDVRNVECDRQP